MSMIIVGPFSLPILPLLLVAAFLVSLTLAQREGPLCGALEFAIYGISIVSVVTARISFVVLHWSVYAQTPRDIVDIRDGGFFPLLGLAAGIIATGFYLLRKPVLKRALPVCLLAGASVAALGGVSTWAIKSPVDMALPGASFTDIDGKQVRLDSFLGRPVIVNLWATWCPPCRREMPLLMHAQASNPAVVFIFANQGESALNVQQYLTQANIDISNVILDSRLEIARLAGSSALPTTLFFDRTGKLYSRRMGTLSAATLAHELVAITGGS